MNWLSYANKLKAFYLLAHVGFGFALLYGSLWWWTASVIMYLVIQTFAVGIGTHRLFTHRSFTTGRRRTLFLTYFSILHVLGSPISWASTHLLHHQTADTEADPHSPHHMAWSSIWLSLYYGQNLQTLRSVRHLIGDRHQVFIHHNYFKLLIAWQLFLMCLGWKFYVFIFCVPTVFVYHITTLGTVLHHVFGYRSFETACDSRNSFILSLFTAGDGWHNNHHQFPSYYRQGRAWWEFDLQAWIIERLFIDRAGAR